MRSTCRPSAFAPTALLLATVLLASCAGSSASPTLSPAASPSATPTISEPAGSPTGKPFTLDVQPLQTTGRSIPGAHVVFLVTVSGEPTDEPATITASAPGTDVAVEPAKLRPGVVGEVSVTPTVPYTCECETNTEITVNATRANVVQTEHRTITIAPGTDELAAEAAAHLAPFLTWLARNRPDLGIGPDTKWDGTLGSWVLIVEHYLFFATDWELDLEWHVMIAPDDWSRIYLRKRWSEVAPSAAFEIRSVSSGDEPREITPPAAVWR